MMGAWHLLFVVDSLWLVHSRSTSGRTVAEMRLADQHALLQVAMNTSRSDLGGDQAQHSFLGTVRNRLTSIADSVKKMLTVPALTPGWPNDYLNDENGENGEVASPGESVHGAAAHTERPPATAGPLHRLAAPEGPLPVHAQDLESNHVEGAHHHGYLCLAFMLGGLGLGSLLQMIQERFLQKVPYTCMLFILGFVFAAIHKVRPQDHWSAWPTWFISVDIWEQIDPHLVFYIFLPVLIFVEAMRLNVKLAAKCLSQVLVLACPGVLIGTFLTALFAKFCFPYSWNWPTALIFGSILSATDPVAVVALFQTLGVSARLTMIISGESLLNDGTAIVLFELMLKLMLGGTINAGGTLLFIIRMAVVSVILGVFLAFLGLAIISWCAESNYHTDSMIQVIVTICLSFLCFFLAENECETSGVITVVSAGCVFSYVAWPRFVSKETMRTVWEALEFVGNTLIFLLAGLLFGHKCFARTSVLNGRDVGYLFLLYIVVTAIRAFMIVFLWPILNLVGTKLTWQESVVMVHAGLRGAVGLVLAIILDLEPTVSHEIGSHVIFHVGGIAMMTIVVNSTSCGPLLHWLEMTKAPEIEDHTTLHLAKVTDQHALAVLDEVLKSDDPRFQGANIETVKSLVPSLTHSADCVNAEVKSAAIDVAARLRMYREIFMRSVQRHYWTDIEEGMIPKNSRIARILLYSTDEALSNPKQSLSDWDSVVENIDHNFRPLQRLCNQWPLRLIPALQQWFPSTHTVEMWKVYAALSFIEAHKAAETKVPHYFDGESVLSSRVQDQVNRESNVQCDKAKALLKNIPDELIELGKSRMLAGKMLQLQLEKVNDMHEEGILHSQGAGKLSHHIHEVQREIVGKAFAGKEKDKAMPSGSGLGASH
mmetsp:Transcript_2828/g.6619  ORF Transcript_2828/g.6619 Transcript_2828/m.6619 type:complete len:881 (-) Transcript_2828:125-2767(-)|eukprot:CAMPEP_0171100590 /NCGR_PEP_ID=MMETSP0766_2-20121228/53048_1 /TAXON_ID=439317 /ORGANISM="Gambierdiscus australes, Strain CAWD 149" /LENGTH=880 /DNA_ID=CAMNT_0011560443 /DNA_START=59 /DNA_END=2701 /DNA_ORIENTATION=+